MIAALRHYIKRFAELPLDLAWRKTGRLLRRKLRTSILRYRDARSPTYRQKFGINRLLQYCEGLDLATDDEELTALRAVTDHYLMHRFDLLGSGWVVVKHGMRCRGLEGSRYDAGNSPEIDPEGRWLERRVNLPNQAESCRIWRLVSPGYRPIDWQLDFKSGHRWSERSWYQDIGLHYGPEIDVGPGIDIKVPWELARMQHLTQIAQVHAVAQKSPSSVRPATVYTNEFRDQILDFISTNPPRFGVNWVCAMDVSIRVANWLLAYDLFRAAGAQFDAEIERIFVRSIYEHGCHIAGNLEWSDEAHSNHYLANIVGLLFVASYLPRSPEIDAWLAFAVQELVNEVGYQFTPDGANFEASTAYHRLSAEMVIFATALVLGLSEEKLAALETYDHRLHRFIPVLKPGPIRLYDAVGVGKVTPFPDWYIERLEKMVEFTIRVTKPNGRVTQIGDNDSGRIFKLSPVYAKRTVREARALYANLSHYDDLPEDAIYWDENHLDHRHLVAAANGLFERMDFSMFCGADQVASHIIRHMAGGAQFGARPPTESCPPICAGPCSDGPHRSWEVIYNPIADNTDLRQCHTNIPIPGPSIRREFRLFGYPDFGLYIYRSSRLYLVIRCGSIGQCGIGAHAHNDQLSIELTVDGEDWISDPGSYLYTPSTTLRNAYRSVSAHFAPQIDSLEPGRLDLGMFRLGDEAKARCLYFGPEGFIGTHLGYGAPIFRSVLVSDDGLNIVDYAPRSLPLRQPIPTGTTVKGWPQSPALSLGYGVILR